MRLEVVVDDAVVSQETQPHCYFVEEEELGLKGEEALVGLEVRIDGFEGTVFKQDFIAEGRLVLREEEASDEE